LLLFGEPEKTAHRASVSVGLKKKLVLQLWHQIVSNIEKIEEEAKKTDKENQNW